jgi:hypothetical protein
MWNDNGDLFGDTGRNADLAGDSGNPSILTRLQKTIAVGVLIGLLLYGLRTGGIEPFRSFANASYTMIAVLGVCLVAIIVVEAVFYLLQRTRRG